MHCPFHVADPRSGLQYSLTGTRLAELSLAPLALEWVAGRVITEAPDPVWAESLVNAPVEPISAVTAGAALGYAANPADVHSGLLLRTPGPDPLPLQTALAAQIDGRLADDPVLMRLNGTGIAPLPSRTVDLGAALPGTGSTAERGTALHLALRTFMARPDLVDCLPAATGLDAATLALVGTRAAALKGWLTERGFNRLAFEVPLLGRSADGAEIPGSIDLLAEGPQGLLLIDHKTGGSGMGLGPYWPQLAAYMGLVAEPFPDKPVLGAAIHWVDQGRLELADAALSSEALSQIGVI